MSATPEQDRHALEALSVFAEVILDPEDRRRRRDFADDPDGVLGAALEADGRSLEDLPPDVLEFLRSLEVEELDVLARLQKTMVDVRGQGFLSLSEVVAWNPHHTAGKL